MTSVSPRETLSPPAGRECPQDGNHCSSRCITLEMIVCICVRLLNKQPVSLLWFFSSRIRMANHDGQGGSRSSRNNSSSSTQTHVHSATAVIVMSQAAEIIVLCKRKRERERDRWRGRHASRQTDRVRRL